MKPALLALALLFAGHTLAAPLDEASRRVLAGYETVRAALAADNLAQAKAAARELDGGTAVAEARSLGQARKAFKVLSVRAVSLARGQPGFFIARCTMYPGGANWVQTSATLSNPYWGRAMPACGELVENPGK